MEYGGKTLHGQCDINRSAQIVGNGLMERDAEDRDLAPYLARTFKGENMV